MMQSAEKFAGTVIYDILKAVDELYTIIEKEQGSWKEKSPAYCPNGCGTCCVHFEPEVYEAEALYLAAWLLEHHSDYAEHIFTTGSGYFPQTDGCFLFDPDSPYHCTVYEGRCLICRLFGYSGNYGKDGNLRWKACKYMDYRPDILVEQTHRQYNEEELHHIFGAVPPNMHTISTQLIALNPENTHPLPLRIALPAALEKLKMILRFLTPPEPDCPSPEPLSA
ncbi:MAG: YkgJ family cysteine cluster protein [Treponema sp.]